MTAALRRAVFLDRDGVLNRSVVRDGKPYPPRSLDELEILPGVPEALGLLREAGFLLLVVTNQPDVARGTQRREVVEAINEALCAALPLDDVFTCYDDGDSPRRKPNPGMILEGTAKYRVDLGGSFLIGDRWKDVEAGRRAGCRTVLLDYGYAETEREGVTASFRTRDLGEAVEWILAHAKPQARDGAGVQGG
jgi:D-glycero-D-manno-heptose 1,7-bisphosphate phosphatase